MENRNSSKAWELLMKDHNILKTVEEKSLFKIHVTDIEKYNPLQLMTGWDCSNNVPESLKINILPVNKNEYVLGNCLVYKKFPNLNQSLFNIKYVDFPNLETINIANINSETLSLKVLLISGILNDFLGLSPLDKLYSTFNGKIQTEEFSFFIGTSDKRTELIDVNNASTEIDAVLESNDYVVIIKFRNILHEDFNISQLYYPYRVWKDRVNKEVKTIICLYSNKIFRILEYRFDNPTDYSSVSLVRTKNYSFDDTQIPIEDIVKTFNNTDVKYDENSQKSEPPFPQANKMERIISLLEQMYKKPLDSYDIMNLMSFSKRQKDYYISAGRYLGIFEKQKKNINGKSEIVYCLTELGKTLYNLNYKKRQLKIVSLILEHKIFRDLFLSTQTTGTLPSLQEIMDAMSKYNIRAGGSTVKRRASSILAWIKWIYSLPNI